MKVRSIVAPVVCGLAVTGWLLVGSAMQGPPPTSVEPSSGVIVARLGARPFLHEGRVRSVAFLGNSRRVVSVDERGLAFWSVPDGDLQSRTAQEPATTQPVRTATATPDGRLVAFAAGAQICVVESQRSGEIRTLGTESTDVSALALTADGMWLAVGVGAQVSIWDVAAGTVRQRLSVTGDRVGAMAFSPDGRRLATGPAYGIDPPRGSAIQLWNLDDGQELRRWESFADGLAFSPDGRTLAGSTETRVDGGTRAALKLYDASSGAELWRVGGTFSNVVFSPDGSRVVAGELAEVKVIDAVSGQEIRTLPYGRNLHIYSLAFSPDGAVLATGADDNRIRLWRTADWTRLDRGEGHDGPAHVVAFSPDGQLVASSGEDGAVRLWSWPSGRPVRTFGVGARLGIQRLRFSDDGDRLAAALGGPTDFVVWDVRRGVQIAAFGSDFRRAAPLPMVFLPDRDRLLAATGDGSIVEWDVPTGAQTRVIGKPLASIRDLALVANGRHVAYVGRPNHSTPSSSSSEVGVLDLATGQPVRTLGQLYGNRLLADPDGSWVMVRDQAWDVTTGQAFEYRFYRDARSAAVSPNGRLIYKTSNYGISVWERLTARDIHTVAIRDLASAGGVAVSPDGRIVAAAHHDGSIVMIDVSAATAAGVPATPQTPSEFEDLWRIMGDTDHWAANVAVWSFAKAGAPAVSFLTGKLAPAGPLADARLAELRAQLSDLDGFTRMTSARALLDHGIALQPADILAMRTAEEEATRSVRGRMLFGGGLSARGREGLSAMPMRVQELDTVSPLPARLRSARAIAALGYSTTPQDAQRLLVALAAGHATDPQTVDAVSALRFLRNR